MTSSVRRRGVERRLPLGCGCFFTGSEGVRADTVSGRHFAIGAIFEFCKDFFTNMSWIGHDFDGYCFFAILLYLIFLGAVLD